MGADEFAELFSGFTKAHGLYSTGATDPVTGKVKGQAVTVTAQPLGPDDWVRHLSGKAPGIGVVPLMDDDVSVRWGAIDIDINTIDHKELEARCEEAGLPVVITKSKSQGAHIWLFCKEPVPAHLVQMRLNEWAAFLGHGGVEVFPKQTSRASETDIGNWINLPHFGSDRLVVQNGKTGTLKTFLKQAKAKQVTVDELMELDLGPKGVEFEDGPPCLQHIHSNGGPIEGGRNNTMFSVGVYYRLKYTEDWQEALFAYNARMDDPLESGEIQAMAVNLAKKEYFYKCTDTPLCNHCNKSLCLKREYGIGDGEDSLSVVLGLLTKYESRPPVWVLEVDGQRVQLTSTDDLITQQRFQRLCVEELSIFPSAVKKNTWTKTIRELLMNVNTIPVPEDASPQGQFFEYLVEFIRNHKTEEKEELATGNAWVDAEDGWVYFRSQYFFDYLKRNSFRDYTAPQMYVMLSSRLDAEQGQMNVKGRVFNYWRVRLTNFQDTPFDVPDYQEQY